MSRYDFVHCSPININRIKYIKVPVAFVNPKDMTVNCLNPLLEVLQSYICHLVALQLDNTLGQGSLYKNIYI